MYIRLKEDCTETRENMKAHKHGLFTTMGGGVAIETRVMEGKGYIENSRVSSSPINYKNKDFDFEIHTGYDHLVLSFANEDMHISVKTGSAKDMIGSEGWRHIAHKIALDLTGEECIADAPAKHVRDNHWTSYSKAVVRHIHKLVDVSKGMINQSTLGESPTVLV